MNTTSNIEATKENIVTSPAEFANLEVFIDNAKPSENSKIMVAGVELKGVYDCNLKISANDDLNMVVATLTVVVKRLHVK